MELTENFGTCILVQLLHYILKCNQFEMKSSIRVLVKIISIPDEELCSETAEG